MPCNNNCNCCPLNCNTAYLNTNIILKDLSSCEGIFTFGPDALTVPGPCGLTGPNTNICPLAVNVQKNCKGDYKITLVDDNDCNLACMIIKCSQFNTVLINSLPASQQALYNVNLPSGYNVATSYILQINANNLNLVGEYVSLEEAAYFYREVCQAYLNLWCGAEKNSIITNILTNTQNVVAAQGTITVANAQFVYNLSQDLIKARVLALKQLCECGKVCNDEFFPQKELGPCAALSGCCPPRYR